jgi:solute carrier family 29 (equilibrative nucleoside transporter), member 1/2/3
MPTLLSEQHSVELQELANMDRIRNAFKPKQAYEPLPAHDDRDADDGTDYEEEGAAVEESPFSWVEYSIFLLMGVAMLWAW